MNAVLGAKLSNRLIIDWDVNDFIGNGSKQGLCFLIREVFWLEGGSRSGGTLLNNSL